MSGKTCFWPGPLLLLVSWESFGQFNLGWETSELALLRSFAFELELNLINELKLELLDLELDFLNKILMFLQF